MIDGDDGRFMYHLIRSLNIGFQSFGMTSHLPQCSVSSFFSFLFSLIDNSVGLNTCTVNLDGVYF